MTGNLRNTTGNLVLHHGSAIYIIIKNNGNATALVSLCQGSPTACTVYVHLHAYAGTAIIVKLIAGVSNHVTFEGSTAITLGHLDGKQLIDIGAFAFANSLNTPLEAEVRRKNFLGFGRLKQLADGIHIALGGIADSASVIALDYLQTAQQRMLAAYLFNVGSACSGIFRTTHSSSQVVLGLGCVSGSSLGCGGVSCFHLAHSGSQLAVQSHQERHNLLGIIGLPEFQVGASLQQLTHAVGFLDTRHFNHDTTLLAFKSLDVGLYHTETVDTGAEHVV